MTEKEKEEKKNFFSHYFAPQCLSLKLSEKSDFLWWRGEQQILWFYVPASLSERWLQNLDHLSSSQAWPLCTRTQPRVWRGGGWAPGRWTHGLGWAVLDGEEEDGADPALDHITVTLLNICPLAPWMLWAQDAGFPPSPLFSCSRVWKWRWHVHYY